MIVHLYGKCAYTDAIGDICRRHNLKLIEDNAQATVAHSAEQTFPDGVKEKWWDVEMKFRIVLAAPVRSVALPPIVSIRGRTWVPSATEEP